MRVEIKKSPTETRGCVDIRDYVVRKCLANDECAEVRYAGDVMTLTPEQLKNDVVITSPLIKTKISGGRDYYLFAYEWNPEKTEL